MSAVAAEWLARCGSQVCIPVGGIFNTLTWYVWEQNESFIRLLSL